MNSRLTYAMKATLALWLSAGLLTAGFLTYLPELHAELHQHHGDCDSQSPADDSPPESDGHLCLVYFMSDGGMMDAALPPATIPQRPVLAGWTLPHDFTVPLSAAHLLPSGRAPPHLC